MGELKRVREVRKVRYTAPDYVKRWRHGYQDAVKATKAVGKAKGKYGVIDFRAVLAHLRAHGGDGGTSKPTTRGAGRARERPLEPKSEGAGGKPPVEPPTARQSAQGGDEPRRYPKVDGDGGEVPFTPDNPPKVTDELLDHVMVGAPGS
jgi:hypothetical protein